ncbi:Ig-like domain-containing protein [Peribacillus asahii]|uniref:Ig-like domain-containing protein n=1 Tax=Peribacillus asahii TaxID=228899 RepID=UPI0037F69594
MRNPIANQTMTMGDPTLNIDISDVFWDEDGDNLRVTAESNGDGIVTATINGTNLVLTPLQAGTVTITVTADDGNGGSAATTFNVTVMPPITNPFIGDISVLNTVGTDEIYVYAPQGFTVKLYDAESGGNLIGQMNTTTYDDENGRPVKNENGERIYRAAFTFGDVLSIPKVFVTLTESGKRESIRTLVPVNSETRIKAKDHTLIQVNDLTGFITVKPSATVDQIKAAIQSKNDTNQSYTFRYNVGDDNFEYSDESAISNIYVSWIDIIAQDGSTTGQYIIDFSQ